MELKVRNGTITLAKNSVWFKIYLNMETGEIWANTYIDQHSYTNYNDENIICIDNGRGYYNMFKPTEISKKYLIELADMSMRYYKVN